MKINRHSKILELINDKVITTQEELLSCLRQEGYDVTQSTVSRDIKQLRLTKALSKDGKYRYTAIVDSKENKNNFTAFLSSIVSVDFAENMVVIKTYSGMAQAVCASIDAMKFDTIIGTLAGEDTIFAVCRNKDSAQKLVSEFKKL